MTTFHLTVVTPDGCAFDGQAERIVCRAIDGDLAILAKHGDYCTALGMGDTTGFVKILADAESDRILGMHIIGANASELISEGVVAMEFGASSEDLARICHAHPTLSEVVHEAALACDKRPLHF